ncbi:MAG: sigma-70 family RNA polymerase sigma factor [Flavobacteriaceae bacterium]|nr:sigma-70 family RNA polymerase sigma factor [Flavobacteriaceae bacterium]
MTIEEIIKGCKRNDRKAQSELFHKFKDSLYFVSLKYCRCEVEAEDNLHDAFITIYSKISTFKNSGSFEGWMKRITMFKAIDRYKKKKTYPIKNQEKLPDSAVVVYSETDTKLNTILNAIQQLPDQYRIVFSMYQLDGYSHKEIANHLSISIGTSKSNLHRAKTLLKEKLKELNPKTAKTDV